MVSEADRTLEKFNAAMDDDLNTADALGALFELVREVFNDDERRQLVETVSGALLGGVRSPVLERAFDYWKSVDAEVGQRIEDAVRAGQAG